MFISLYKFIFKIALITSLSLSICSWADNKSLSVHKLKPSIRVEKLTHHTQVIPIEQIKPFISGTHIIELEQVLDAPYIVAMDKLRIMSSTGDTIYVKNLKTDKNSSFSVISLENPITDPETNTVMGYFAADKGDAVLQKFGNPSKLVLKKISKEVKVGDYLLVLQDQGVIDYKPHIASKPFESMILASKGSHINLGRNQVVTILGGKREGVEIGNVYSIHKAGHIVEDNIHDDENNKKNTKVKIPATTSGKLMVFRTYKHLSQAIILSATDVIRVHDKVSSDISS